MREREREKGWVCICQRDDENFSIVIHKYFKMCNFLTSFLSLILFQPSFLQEKNFQDFVNGVTDILVTTDIASRGLDTLDVKHVINFDFPRSPIDYLHRGTGVFVHLVKETKIYLTAGRTGRLGKKGVVSNFVTKGDEKIGGAVQDALERGERLEFIDLSGVRIPGAPSLRFRFHISFFQHNVGVILTFCFVGVRKKNRWSDELKKIQKSNMGKANVR